MQINNLIHNSRGGSNTVDLLRLHLRSGKFLTRPNPVVVVDAVRGVVAQKLVAERGEQHGQPPHARPQHRHPLAG
eukprot:9129485-Pyramimonas_sp.AAC.1